MENGSAVKRNILVTGAAGFIGSHLVPRLVNNGHRVIGLDNFDTYYDAEFKQSNLKEAGAQARFVQADIRDETIIRSVLSGHNIDTVIHLAARPGVRLSLAEPLPYFQINVEGTAALLQACRNSSVERFIFASSSSVYGDSEGIPAVEDVTPLRPLSPYGASKVAGEAVCYTYSRLYDMPILALRFFTVYGPRQRPDMAIHKFTKLIDAGDEIPVFGDGLQQRDFTYISDIVDGVAAGAERTLVGFQAVNLGGASPVDVLTVIELIARNLRKEARISFQPLQPGEPTTTFANVSKAGALLGFEPKVGIEEGISNFVAWYKERRNVLVGAS